MKRRKRKRGAPKLSTMVLIFLGVMAIMLLLRARNAKGVSMDFTDPENESKHPSMTSVEHTKVQCFEFILLSKKVCAHPGSELANGVHEKVALDVNFTAMAIFSSDDRRIPKTSWLEIAKFSSVSRVFVHLSDGEIIYVAGEGNTFEEAMDNLFESFLTEDAGNSKHNAVILI